MEYIPKKLEWEAQKRALPLIKVNPAYSSQECNRCHRTGCENRINQQTFYCECCGYRANTDVMASINLKRRLHDEELKACSVYHLLKPYLHQGIDDSVKVKHRDSRSVSSRLLVLEA